MEQESQIVKSAEVAAPNEVRGIEAWTVHRDRIKAILERGTVKKQGVMVPIWSERRTRMEAELARLEDAINSGYSTNTPGAQHRSLGSRH